MEKLKLKTKARHSSSSSLSKFKRPVICREALTKKEEVKIRVASVSFKATPLRPSLSSQAYLWPFVAAISIEGPGNL